MSFLQLHDMTWYELLAYICVQMLRSILAMDDLLQYCGTKALVG